MPFLQRPSDIPFPFSKFKAATQGPRSGEVQGQSLGPEAPPSVPHQWTGKAPGSQRAEVVDNNSIIQDYIRDSGLVEQIKASTLKTNQSSPGHFLAFGAEKKQGRLSQANAFDFGIRARPVVPLGAGGLLGLRPAPGARGSEQPLRRAVKKSAQAQGKRTDIVNFHVSEQLKPYILNANYQPNSSAPKTKVSARGKENLQLSGATQKSRFDPPSVSDRKPRNFDREADELNRSLTRLKNDLLVKKESLINEFMLGQKHG